MTPTMMQKGIQELWHWFSRNASKLGEECQNEAVLAELDGLVTSLGDFGSEVGPGRTAENAFVISPAGKRVLLHLQQGRGATTPMSSVRRDHKLSMQAAIIALCAAGCGKASERVVEDSESGVAADSGAEIADAASADAGAEDDSAVPEQEFVPGTRLRPLRMTVGDSVVLLGHYDSSLEAPCTFRATNEGVRCVPETRDEIEYLDPECKTPVVRARNITALLTSPYGLELDTRASCGLVIAAVYRATSTVDNTACATFARGLGGRCEERTADATPEGELFFAEPVPLTSLVAETRTRLAGTGRLRASYAAGDDGSLWRTGWYDVERSTPCEPVLDEAGERRCLSTRRALGGGAVFADPYCTQEAVVASRLCDSIDLLAYSISAACAPERNRFVELGRRWPSEYFVKWHEQDCSSELAATHEEVREALPIAGEAFPVMGGPRGAENRIRPDWERAVGLPDYFNASGGGFEDTMLGTRCTARATSEGWRCMPAETAYGFFQDAECTKPLLSKNDECSVPGYVSVWGSTVATGWRVGDVLNLAAVSGILCTAKGGRHERNRPCREN